LRSLY